MTSDKAVQSHARDLLDYSLGRNRVSLKELSPEEFDTLLLRTLYDIDLRELRGFTTLKEMLTQRSYHPPTRRTDPSENVSVSSHARIYYDNAEDVDLLFQSHVVRVCRGVVSQVIIFRRYESEEETTDYDTAQKWEGGGYIRMIKAEILILRRPTNHTRADRNLFLISYFSEKVTHKNEMVVNQVLVKYVPLDLFRSIFGQNYPRVGCDLIHELSILTSKTVDALTSQAESLRLREMELQRLSSSIME